MKLIRTLTSASGVFQGRPRRTGPPRKGYNGGYENGHAGGHRGYGNGGGTAVGGPDTTAGLVDTPASDLVGTTTMELGDTVTVILVDTPAAVLVDIPTIVPVDTTTMVLLDTTSMNIVVTTAQLADTTGLACTPMSVLTTAVGMDRTEVTATVTAWAQRGPRPQPGR